MYDATNDVDVTGTVWSTGSTWTLTGNEAASLSSVNGCFVDSPRFNTPRHDDFELELDELDRELGLIEAALERARQAYRPLVRARRRHLPLELTPPPCLARSPKPVTRRRARAEPMGLRNYQRQDRR